MTPRRGRRDNGLDAVLWSPLRDVDPRVGEHLLDLLHAVGHRRLPGAVGRRRARTRARCRLPSPPSDRLFVDRARRAEARASSTSTSARRAARPARRRSRPRPAPERAAVRPDLDEDAEWARIVAAFEAENGRPTSSRSRPPLAAPPVPHELPILDRPDEHYEPPPPPPLPVPAPASLYAVLLVVARRAARRRARACCGLSADVGLMLGVAAIAGGVAMLVSRMRDRSDDDGDDGAVV